MYVHTYFYKYVRTTTYQGRSVNTQDKLCKNYAQWSKHETKQMKRHETKLTDTNGNCIILRSQYIQRMWRSRLRAARSEEIMAIGNR